MNEQRIMFAFARGAKIQFRYHDDFPWTTFPFDGQFFYRTAEYRIHPDDEHLQYGPLSRAVRLSAASGVALDLFAPACSTVICLHPELTLHWWSLEGDERRMFWLFLAELLADEGL